MLTLLTFEFLTKSNYSSKSNKESATATNFFRVTLVGKNSNLHGAGLTLLAHQHRYQCNTGNLPLLIHIILKKISQ